MDGAYKEEKSHLGPRNFRQANMKSEKVPMTRRERAKAAASVFVMVTFLFNV